MKRRMRRGTPLTAETPASRTLFSTTRTLDDATQTLCKQKVAYMRPTRCSSMRNRTAEKEQPTFFTQDSSVAKEKHNRKPAEIIMETSDKRCWRMIHQLREKYRNQPMNQGFLAWDKDRSGTLDYNEVCGMLNLLGYDEDPGISRKFYDIMRSHGGGKVNYEAFSGLFGRGDGLISPSNIPKSPRAYTSEDGTYNDPYNREKLSRTNHLFHESKNDQDLAEKVLQKIKTRYEFLARPQNMLRKWDTNRDGKVCKNDCKTVLRSMNVNLNESELDAFYSLLKSDKNKSPEVTFKDMMENVLLQKPKEPTFKTSPKKHVTYTGKNEDLDRVLVTLREHSEKRFSKQPLRKLFQSISGNSAIVDAGEFNDKVKSVCPELSNEDVDHLIKAAGGARGISYSSLSALYNRKLDSLPASRNPAQRPQPSLLLKERAEQQEKTHRGRSYRNYNILQADPNSAMFCADQNRFYRKALDE